MIGLFGVGAGVGGVLVLANGMTGVSMRPTNQALVSVSDGCSLGFKDMSTFVLCQ